MNAAGVAYGLCDSGDRLCERIKYVADRAEAARFKLEEIEEILRDLAILFPDEDVAPVDDRGGDPLSGSSPAGRVSR